LSFLLLYFIFTSSVPDNEAYHYILTPVDSIATRIIISHKSMILYAITDPKLVLLLPIFFYSVYLRFVLHKEISTGRMIMKCLWASGTTRVNQKSHRV